MNEKNQTIKKLILVYMNGQEQKAFKVKKNSEDYAPN